MAIRLVKNQDPGLVVRSTINDLVNYANSNSLPSGSFLNTQTYNSNINIPAGYNGLLVGPINNNAEISIEPTANLTIL